MKYVLMSSSDVYFFIDKTFLRNMITFILSFMWIRDFNSLVITQIKCPQRCGQIMPGISELVEISQAASEKRSGSCLEYQSSSFREAAAFPLCMQCTAHHLRLHVRHRAISGLYGNTYLFPKRPWQLCNDFDFALSLCLMRSSCYIPILVLARQLIVIIFNCGFCKRNALVCTFIFLNSAFLGCVASKDNLVVLVINLIGLGRRQSCLFQRTIPGGGDGKFRWGQPVIGWRFQRGKVWRRNESTNHAAGMLEREILSNFSIAFINLVFF